MHGRQIKAWSLAVLPLLAACTVGPNYAPPRLDTEAAYGHEAATQPAQEEAALAHWWVGLGDPALDGLVAAAARNNLDVQQAEARIREARAQRLVVAAAYGPDVNASGEYQHNRFSQNAAPFDAFSVPNFPWEFNNYQAGFDASWEIDVFGGTRRAVEAANASIEAGEEDRRAVLVSLLGEVALNYVELRGYQDRRQIAEKNLSAQQETLTLTRDQVAKGIGRDLDVSRATAEAASTAAQIPVYERLEWQTLHRLAVLTHQPLEAVLYLRKAGPIPAGAAAIAVGVPTDLLRRRPDIRRAERQLAAATARIGVAQADLYPRLSLIGYFDLQSASVEEFLDWRSRAFSLGPTIMWPVFQSGRLRAVVQVRDAQADQALLTYEQSVQGAVAEVRDAMVALSTERRRQASLAEAVKADGDAVNLAEQLYRQGLTDFLTVLDAQRQLYLAQDALSQSEMQVTASVISFYKALGGGWEEPGAAPRPTTARKESMP